MPMETLKEVIKEKYGQIARQSHGNSCDCSCGCGSVETAELYPAGENVRIANLGLGCGIPTQFADLREGMTVLDLGSGAGIDAFISSKHVGAAGKVIGVDMTTEMIQRAKDNARQLGIPNVDFLLGEIENLPLPADSVDRIISNCVLNLLPDKVRAFSEMFRVLKAGGAFCVSDVVTDGEVPDAVKRDTLLWAGCVAGAIERKEYLRLLSAAGFRDIHIASEREYPPKASEAFRLFSITVTGKK